MYKLEFWQNLLLICEIISNGYFLVSWNFLFIFVIFCGLVVVISKNPVISIIYLIGLFSEIASYLITLGFSFIGLYYYTAYYYIVWILSLFILMLIYIRISELENYSNNSISFSLGGGKILCKQTNIGIRFYSSKVQLPYASSLRKPRIPVFLQYQDRRIKKHNLSLTASTTTTMNPWFITGLIDGEGCFHVSVTENKNYKHGWHVQLKFSLGLHERDKPVIEEIIKFFNVGSINFEHGPKTIQYIVLSIKELKVILEHLEKYPLRTQKQSDHLALKLVYLIIKNKEHFTPEGLRKIVAIKASMNRGLSEKLSVAFLDVVRVERPLHKFPKTIEPEWFAGFTSGEGCFLIRIIANKTNSLGHQVQLLFQLTQHSRDYELMKMFIIYLECGYVIKDRDSYKFCVTKFQDIAEKIIPFFKKHRIRGVKALDFDDWCKVAEMMKQKKTFD